MLSEIVSIQKRRLFHSFFFFFWSGIFIRVSFFLEKDSIRFFFLFSFFFLKKIIIFSPNESQHFQNVIFFKGKNKETCMVI
jgi:hypothetical protein